MPEIGAPSEFVIRVVHLKTGKTVEWAPGKAVEQEFESDLLRRVNEKGVGIARTSAHVIEDVRRALRELLLDLKSKV